MSWKKLILGTLIFIAVERFCYVKTGTFALTKMVHENSPPSPTSAASPIELQQPLRFIGAGKQFFAFETADGQYVVKFMKWSRRRPLPLFCQTYNQARSKRALDLQKSCSLALTHLPHETHMVIPRPLSHFTLIDNLGIQHTVSSASTLFYVQRKAIPFTHYFDTHPSEAPQLLHSYIQTITTQCRKGISNFDAIPHRNYGVVDRSVMLIDIGSLLQSRQLSHTAAIQQEIVLELLPLRHYLQHRYPHLLPLFDQLTQEGVIKSVSRKK